MSLQHRLVAMEKRIAVLEERFRALDEALAAEDEPEASQTTMTLDGDAVDLHERDQTKSLG